MAGSGCGRTEANPEICLPDDLHSAMTTFSEIVLATSVKVLYPKIRVNTIATVDNGI